jgi:kinesin family protein 6/9
LDLLSPIPTHEQKGEISIQEDTKGNLIIKGLSRHLVSNEEEAFNLVFEGEANRTISEHQLNKESTRSHCIFTMYLEMKSRIESSEKVMTSKLNFVDLAGSERVKKTGSTGITLKEANYINKSLSFLEQVVVNLTDKSFKRSKLNDHTPYRQSKLTHLLKDSIGGNCRTVMIATMWPEEPYINETLSTLNFAKRMMNIVNEATVNIQLDTQALLKKFSKEIKELKQELAMHNTLTNRGRISYDPYTVNEQFEQQQIAERFLKGESEEIEFESVRQAKELFRQCRFFFQKYYQADKEIIDEKGNRQSIKDVRIGIVKQNTSQFEGGVGILN